MAGEIKLTLNDFKAVLGMQNDGDVKLDGKGGIKKVNFGGKFTRIFRPTVTMTPEENRAMRKAFMAAILDSREGKLLTAEKIRNIKAQLGIATEEGGEDNLAILDTKLERRTIAQVMRDVTGGAVGDGKYEELVQADSEALIGRGACTQEETEAAREYVHSHHEFDTAESMAKFAKKEVPGKLFGFSTAQIVKFVKNNAALVKEMVFARACYVQRNARAGGNGAEALAEKDPKLLFFAGVRDLMQAYAEHREVKLNFRGLVPTPPGLDMENPPALDGNPQLAGFQARLNGFDGFIDALFEKKEPQEGRPLDIMDLRNARANTVVKHELRQTILNALAVCQNDARLASEQADLKPLMLLLNLSAESLTGLSEKARAALRGRFFAAVSEASYKGGPDELKNVMKGLAKALKPLAEATDTEAQLRAAFAETGIDQSKYETLKASLMVNGQLDEPCRASCNTYGRAEVARLNERLENPGLQVPERSEAADARRALAQAFRAADARLSEGAEARKELIENFSHDKDRNNFPAYLNGDDPALNRMRSKMHLMCLVLTKAQCQEVGLERSAAQIPFLKFHSLDGIDYDKATEEKIKAEGKLDDFKAELATFERKLDELLSHVSAQEIKANKQYYDLQGDVFEAPLSGGRTLMLDAMRDHLIPDSLTRDTFPLFCAMFYGSPLSDNGTMDGLHVSDLKSLDAIKNDWELRFSEALLYKNHKAADEAKKELDANLAAANAKQYDKDADKVAALHKCYDTAIRKVRDSIRYTGFGSQDVVETFRLLKRCGINVEKLDPNACRLVNGKMEPPDFDRAMALMQIIELRGGSAKGIVEWFERVSGKPITELSRAEVIELQRKDIEDPLDAVKEKTAAGKAIRFLKGEYAVGQAGLGKAERIRLSQALGTLARRLGGDLTAADRQTVTIGGVGVTLGVDVESRQLIGTIRVGNRDLPIAYPLDVGDLNSQLQNDIVANLGEYLGNEADKTILLGIIPDEAAAANNISRARELCTRIIAKITERSSVDFASMTMAELRDTATGLINGTIAKETVAPALSQSYNSREAIELGTAMLAQQATLEKISWSAVVDPLPPPAEREGVKPSDARIRDFAADLLMNKNTWVYDVESGEAAGTRTLKLLKGYAPEIRYILANPESLDVLADAVKDAVAGIIDEIRNLAPQIGTVGTIENLDLASGDVANKVQALETRVKGMLTSTIATLQTKITNLFVGQQGVATDLWKRTSADINGTGGLDVTTPQGKFIKDVLDKYFKGASEIDQRAMLSAFIRNSAPGDSEGKLAGELIKGAGPLLQKMLQGLPVETFPPETQEALQDTRSNLAPIPREVVNARLANMITSSNGFITGIEVKKSLGAASVGQAFLCRIYTKDHPCTGEEVVVKILRPNVETAARREYALISEIAREQGNGMEVSFADRYAGILKEFDFTIESGNVDRGAVYSHALIGSERAQDIEAMGRYNQVLPTTGALVLQKAEGTPVSNFTRDARKRFNAILDPIRGKAALERGGEAVDTFTVKDDILNVRLKRMELKMLHGEIVEKRKKLGHLVQAWFQQAFEGGFVHGDMHSGNIMSGENAMTIIDFGNCTFLSETERNAVLVGLAACVFGEAVDGGNPSTYLLKCLKTLTPPADRARLDAALNDAGLKQDLAVALSRGTKLDVVTRMLSSLTLIQNRGYPLPESITVFTQSLSRLQAAINDADTLLGEIEEAADAIGVDAELKSKYQDPNDRLTKAEGGFEIFRDLDKIIVDATGDSGVPPKDNDALRNKMHAHYDDEEFPGRLLEKVKSENRELVEDNWGLTFIDLVLTKYGDMGTADLSSVFGVTRPHAVKRLTDFVEQNIESHRRLVAAGGDPEALAASRDKVLKLLMKSVADFGYGYTNYHDQITDHDQQLPSFEASGYLAMKTVLQMKIDGKNKAECVTNATKLFTGAIDKLSGVNFAGLVGRNAEGFFKQVAHESDHVKKITTHCSDTGDQVNFVSRRSRRLLQNLAKDFLIPPGGITEENCDSVIDANLAQIRKTLGKESLTLAEMRYFVRLVEKQNWKPSFGVLSTSYNSPFKALDSKKGDVTFLCAMHNRQNSYLSGKGLNDLVQDPIDEEVETELRANAPENQVVEEQKDDDE